MEPKTLLLPRLHSLLLGSLSKCQKELIKGPVVDMDNCFNEVFSSFNPLNPEFALSCRIIDNFSSHFLFNLFSKHSNNNLKLQIHQLDNMTIESLNNPSHVLIIITDASIKNNIATSISHIHIWDVPIIKTLHHIVNIMSTETELFAIRCGVNQATNSSGISKIIVVTDLIYAAWKIFNVLSHFFQIHMAAILRELCLFFSHSQDNSIKFWECPSRCNWSLYKVVDKETKSFNSILLFLLQRIPRGCSMDKGKGHDVNNRLRRSSISQRLM